MRKGIVWILGLALLLSLLAGCAGEEPGENTLVYGSADYETINPIMNEHCEIKHLLFDGLVKRDGAGNLVPSLAREWSYDPDTLTYTFRLREDVTWHDGERFTAEDVAFTISAIMDPENASENYPNFLEVAQIQVLSDAEIAFRLSEPNYAFLDYMTMSILPKHCLEGEDMWESDYFRAPIGTGPYRLAAWDVGQAITLEKNGAYFDEPAKIDTIIFKIVTDDGAKALQLRNGELDLAQVTPRDAQTLESVPGLTVYDMKTADYRGILYNFWNPYWQENADLIPAISYCIDREAILEAVLLGKGFVAYSPIQLNAYVDPDMERYTFDLDKAAEAFTAAGCQRDEAGFWCRNGERIGFTISATPGDQVRIDMAQIAAQQLRDAGLAVQAEVPTEGIDWGGQEACIIGWGSPYDADDHTYKVFGTDMGANYSGYTNALVDKYLTLARQTEDPQARGEYYRQFQQALAQEPAYTFFCYLDAMYVAGERVQGIAADTVLGHHGVGLFWNITQWTLA